MKKCPHPSRAASASGGHIKLVATDPQHGTQRWRVDQQYWRLFGSHSLCWWRYNTHVVFSSMMHRCTRVGSHDGRYNITINLTSVPIVCYRFYIYRWSFLRLNFHIVRLVTLTICMIISLLGWRSFSSCTISVGVYTPLFDEIATSLDYPLIKGAYGLRLIHSPPL